MPTETIKNAPDPNKIKLINVRLSYPHLFEAKQQKGSSKAKFSADFILRKKEHADQIKQIEKIIERVKLDKFKKAVTLKADKCCLHDGNDRQEKEGYGDEVMYVVAKNDCVFPIVDKDPRVPLTKQSGKPYGGCYVNVLLRFYAYDHPEGGKGVSASLEGVQFFADGVSFGGGAPIDPEAEFDEVPAGGASDDVNNY